MKEGRRWGPCRRPRSSHRRRLICYSVPLSHPPHVRSVRRFRLLIATCPCFPRPVPSFRRRPVLRLARRLVPRFVVVPPLVSSSSRFLVSFLVPPRRLVPHSSARPAPRFLDTAGRGVFSFDSEAGKQARGRGGAWDSDGRGVHAIGEGHGQASRRGGGG